MPPHPCLFGCSQGASHAAAVEDAAKRSKTASSSASAGVLPPRRAAKPVECSARQGNEKETARASPPFGAGCFWLYTSSMDCDRSVHAPSELNRPSRQPVPGPCSASSSAGTSAAFRTASPARIRLPSPGRARAGSRQPRAAPAPLRALRPLRRASQGDLLSSVRIFAALRGGIAVSAQLSELPSDREQSGGSHEEDKPTHHESPRSPHPMSQPGSHPSASANAHSLSAPGV